MIPPSFRLLLGVVFWPAVLAGQAPTPPCSVWCLATQSSAAVAAHRHADNLRYASGMVARAPDLPFAVYTLAHAYALLGRRTEAISQLDRLADLGSDIDLSADSGFASLRGSSAFTGVMIRLRGNRVPVIAGVQAFTIPDPDFLPEALEHDPISGGWLVGSLAGRKVIRLLPDGSATDFITGSDLLRVVGIHADSARGRLWFATWAPRPDGSSQTRLFRSDLATGEIQRRYAPPDSGASHLFNDLVIARNGDVFITDTDRGWIYRVRAADDSLEVFVKPDSSRLTFANGITLSGDNRTLYAGFAEGIARIDLRTRAIARLLSPARGSTAAPDGLYWHRGYLVAVVHRPGIQQVTRLFLSPDGNSVATVQVLQRGDSLLRLPTTGAFVGDKFYYIATSQYDRLGEDNQLTPSSLSPAPRSTVRMIDFTPQ